MSNKIYLGKGKQVKDYDMVQVSINLDEAAQHSHEYEGVNYLTFTVARLKEADNYGKTHTAYISQLPEENSK